MKNVCKIKSVIEIHAKIWCIDRIDREIISSTTSAKFYMTGK